MIKTTQLALAAEGFFTVINITEQVRDFVRSTGVSEGQVLVYYRHTTGGIILGEHEAGIIADLQDSLEKVAPVAHEYHHHVKAADFNGHTHVRSALLTVSVTVPIMNGDLMLGTWQEIMVFDDQVSPLTRYVALQVMGE